MVQEVAVRVVMRQMGEQVGEQMGGGGAPLPHAVFDLPASS